MTQCKHTPGPWHVTECMDYWVQAGDLGVALCGEMSWSDEDSNAVRDQSVMEANARLIAAAPDMLRALQMIADEGHPFHDSNCLCKICIAVRASLSKAEGK